MHLPHHRLMTAYWAICIVTLVIAGGMVAGYAPVEATMGPVQKIFYLHLPVAVCMFGGCIGVFVAAIGYIWQRHERWDHLSLAFAEVSVMLASIVLVTGMIWGHHAWGHWWTWSPRLTFSLILWLLYFVYLMLHRSLQPGHRRAMICAMYGIVAFIDVPLVYLSVKLLPDIHPSDVQLAPAMRTTLLVCFVPALLITAGYVLDRYRHSRPHQLEAAQPAPQF